MSDKMELKPCPFCGDPLVEIESVVDGDDYLRSAYVCCDRCGAKGPELAAMDQAIDFWNTRAASSPTHTVVPDNLPYGWEFQPHTNTVICGGCLFRFGAEHPDGDGKGWTCANCGDGNNPSRASHPDAAAEYLYIKFATDPSIEWQNASEKLKDVWRKYAREMPVVGEFSKTNENSK